MVITSADFGPMPDHEEKMRLAGGWLRRKAGGREMAGPLALQHLKPLAKGSVRLVFEHPDNSDLLIKVMRPDRLDVRYGAGAAWFRRRRRFDPYRMFVREIREYIAAYASHGHSVDFAQQVRGLVETDLGLGLLTDAARGPDGQLAPTVAKLIATGCWDAAAQAALEDFLTALLASDLVIADLHERNMVYACAAGGRRRFVMIDGLGSCTVLPFKSWSRTMNRRSKLRRMARLRQRIARRVAAYQAGKPLP